MSTIDSLNRQGWIAVLLGACTGLFFGPPAYKIFQPMAEVFSMLVQMAVFPYVCFSLVLGIGSSEPKILLSLLKRGLPFVIALSFIAYLFVFFLSQLIPDPHTPFLYAKEAGTHDSSFSNLIEHLLPKNGFYDLATNMIQAGGAFSVLIGIALLRTEKKNSLIPYLERGIEILEKIFLVLRRYSPFGIFLYLSVSFSIFQFSEFIRIAPYTIPRILLALVFIFWIFPLILTHFTTVSKREIFKAYKEVCLIPFLMGSPALVIPFLELYFKNEKGELIDRSLRITIPSAYCIGQTGSALTYFLATYLAFYYRFPLSLLDKVFMSSLLVPLTADDPVKSFESNFLIQQFHLPPDALEFHGQASLIMHHFGVLMSLSSVLCIILYLLKDPVQKSAPKKRCAAVLSTFFLLFLASVYTTKPYVQIDDYYLGLYQNLNISDVIKEPVAAKVLRRGEAGTPRDPLKSTLAQILETGVLKVGVETNEIPYSFINKSNEIAGFDIAYAYQLAKDLDCSLEFVPLNLNEIGEELWRGDYDIGMSSLFMTEDRLKKMNFSQPYQVEDNVLVLPRSNQYRFQTLRDFQTLNLSILAMGADVPIAKKHFPNASVVSSLSPDPFLSHQTDLFLWMRTSAVIWCLEHPEFITVDYGDVLGKSYLGYPFRSNDLVFAGFMNNWLGVKQENGFKKLMTDYWIKGEVQKKKTLRWSLLQEILKN